MPRVIEGTGQKFQVLKSTGGVRKLRCTRCGDMAIEMPDGKGGTVVECPRCHLQVKTVKL